MICTRTKNIQVCAWDIGPTLPNLNQQPINQLKQNKNKKELGMTIESKKMFEILIK